MRIREIFEDAGNTSINGVLDIMASDRVPLNKNYCHYQTSSSIKNGRVDDNDYILMLGSGKFIAHTIIVDNDGDIKVDSCLNDYVGQKNGTFFYNIHGRNKGYDVVYSMPVSKFKKQYLDN